MAGQRDDGGVARKGLVWSLLLQTWVPGSLQDDTHSLVGNNVIIFF